MSYNVYPGCHVRQAAWEIMRYHIRGIEDARSRLDAARTLAGAMAEPGITQDETDGLLRREFARIARQTDGSIYHDDLGVPNDPVYFHEFAAHARGHGFTFVSEAKPFNSSGMGVAPSMQRLIAGLDRLVSSTSISHLYGVSGKACCAAQNVAPPSRPPRSGWRRCTWRSRTR